MFGSSVHIAVCCHRLPFRMRKCVVVLKGRWGCELAACGCLCHLGADLELPRQSLFSLEMFCLERSIWLSCSILWVGWGGINWWWALSVPQTSTLSIFRSIFVLFCVSFSWLLIVLNFGGFLEQISFLLVYSHLPLESLGCFFSAPSSHLLPAFSKLVSVFGLLVPPPPLPILFFGVILYLY